MNTFSKISLLLVASSALFLPACGGGGGGGGNSDYFISVQNFKTGAKGFYVSASPSATIKADPAGIIGNYFSLSQGFVDIFDTNFGQGTDAVEDGERSYGDDSGVYTKGSFTVNGSNSDPVDLGYYTVGGSSGQGYLYIAFQTDTPSSSIAHFMGASMPEDVTVAGGTNGGDYWVMPDEDARQLLIVSMNGAIMKIVFDFAAGYADVRLCVSSAYKVGSDTDTGTEGGGNMNEHYEAGADDAINNGSEVVLSLRRMPFFAVSGI